MSPAMKFLIGLAAALIIGWLYHGPMGAGERFVSGLDAGARQAVESSEIEGVQVRIGRDPLTRTAILSGQADRFQREGQGSLKGLNQRVTEVPGVAGVDWTDEPGGRAIPLLIEVLLQVTLAYLVGLGLAWFFWGRKREDNY